MARTPEQVAKLIADAWDLYQRIPRVKQSVDLYAAGFAFGELILTVMRDGGVEAIPVIVDAALMRKIAVDLYVAGLAQADIEVTADQVCLHQGQGCEFSYSTESRGPERGALWPVAVNHAVLTSPERMLLAESFMDPMSPLFIPTPLLSTETAALISGGQIAEALVVYAVRVRDMKFCFSAGVRQCLNDLLQIVAHDWKPAFYPGVQGQSGILALGSVYRVFEGEGIDLANVKKEATELVSLYRQSGAMAQNNAQSVAGSFGS